MKAVLALLFFTIALKSQAGLEYYPKSFIRSMQENSIQKNFSKVDLHHLVFEILTKKHLVSQNGEQTLVTECESFKKRCYEQKSLSYRQARKHLFGQLHLSTSSNGQFFIKDVYCNKDYGKHDRNIGTIGPMQIPNANVLNCEHTWPQSKFSHRFPTHSQKGDLHHLFPTNSKSNSLRSNYPFGEVDTVTNTVPNCNGPALGTLNENGNRLFFTPPKLHRGNVARALFYFSTRYSINISSTQEAFLRKWHKEDPVDRFEQERNDAIEEIQFNRNPYIDFPELVSKIANF